jgi:hypothetical protein
MIGVERTDSRSRAKAAKRATARGVAGRNMATEWLRYAAIEDVEEGQRRKGAAGVVFVDRSPNESQGRIAGCASEYGVRSDESWRFWS